MNYLTTDDVIQIHDRIVQHYGGASTALRDFGMLDSACAVPQQAVFGTELYPTLHEKAGILFFLLIQNHPFVDGNKRTAVACLERFLEMNGYRLDATDDELFDLTVSVATAQTPKEEVAPWIEQRLTTL